MLTSVNIQNFKCFKSLSLPLAPMTLLTGFNAAGKSTTLQSILLITQALRAERQLTTLPLNGSLLHLGTPGEILNSGDDGIVLGIDDESVAVKWILKSEDRVNGHAMTLHEIIIRDRNGEKTINNFQNICSLLPSDASPTSLNLVGILKDIVFLSAIRHGAMDVFPSPEDSSIHADVGVAGEFAPWWFQQYMDEDVALSRCNPADEAKTLRRQFNAWASELFPGVQGNVQIIEKTDLLRLELKIGEGDWRRPSNIGYGLTYAFPILIAGLLAKPGQMILIDSPEAHLHPKGQSQMGRFLAQVAASGVQVVVETHSDHVLNGVRLAIIDKLLAHDNLVVNFFNHPSEDGNGQVTSLVADENGNLNEWPSGFFDQAESDMARIAGWQ